MNEPTTAAPPKDLKQIALDFAEGKIFCDRQIQDKTLLLSVFMPLALMKREQFEHLLHVGKAYLIYEYLEEAGPRAINGLPMFMSFRYLTEEEANEVQRYINEVNEFRKAFKEDKV